MLHFVTHGQDTDLPPLLIIHGLFGSARNWGVIAKRMSNDRKVVAIDMRNHGNSPSFATHTYADMAADLAEVIISQGSKMDVVGHSMGGKAAMVLALTHPHLINRLIIADIAPVEYSHSQIHHIEAMQAVDLSEVKRRSDAADQLAQQGTPPELQSFFTQSLDVAGQRWLLNLDTLAQEMPKILSFPEVSGHWDGAALFLAGGTSDYIAPEHRPKIKKLFPNARFAKIPQAGHWLHAEKPREFEATLRVFFD